jgi:hypothetical protein
VVSHVWCMPPPQSSPFYRFYFQSSVVGTFKLFEPPAARPVGGLALPGQDDDDAFIKLLTSEGIHSEACKARSWSLFLPYQSRPRFALPETLWSIRSVSSSNRAILLYLQGVQSVLQY